MTVCGSGRKPFRCLEAERLEDRLLPDSAPIGPIRSPDNTVPFNHAYFSQINASLAAVDVPALMRVHSKADADLFRDDLLRFIWKEEGFPYERLPKEVIFDVPGPLGGQYPDLPNLGRVDRLVVMMDHGLTATLYLFHPKVSNERLLIWHQGHDDDLAASGGYRAMATFLDRGWSILASWMPLLGENTLRESIQIGDCTLTAGGGDHDEFACTETEQFTPLKYFVEPVAVGLNHALAKSSYQDVAMLGLSGGGWVTTLYAALDPRVRVSIPVAGTLPLHQRVPLYYADVGDWEQSESAIYALGDYLDWYVLGSYGPGRKQVQVLNKYDNCCFAGVRFRTYLDPVKETVQALGAGSFTAFLDDSLLFAEKSQSHQISEHALTAVVLHELDDAPVQFVDDGENTYWNGGGTDRDTFHLRGQWTVHRGNGFAGDVRTTGPGLRDARALWQFKVAPGLYQVAVTWTAGGAAAAASAPFAIYDDTLRLGQAAVDQRTAPLDFVDAGVSWLVLGEFKITSTRLVVELTRTLDGFVLADGVRVERFAPGLPAPGPAPPEIPAGGWPFAVGDPRAAEPANFAKAPVRAPSALMYHDIGAVHALVGPEPVRHVPPERTGTWQTSLSSSRPTTRQKASAAPFNRCSEPLPSLPISVRSSL